MAANKEIEIKFRIENLRSLLRKLPRAGFRLVTKRTHEMNTLYDLPGEVLRRQQQLLRLRQYGSKWKLTHKAGKTIGRHSSRAELETEVSNGKKMDLILRALGYASVISLREVSRRVVRWKRAGCCGRDSDREFLRDRGPAALDRQDGREAGSIQWGLHHEELRDVICRLEGSKQK